MLNNLRLFEEWKLNELGEVRVDFNPDSTGRSDWDNNLKNNPGKFKVIRTMMSPDKFLERVMHTRFNIDFSKVNKFIKDFSEDGTIIPTPTMWFVNKYQYDSGFAPAWHDGTHRALALKKLGITTMPVLIIYEA